MFSRRPPARDIDTFLAGYPDLPSEEEEDKSWDRNLRFYLGEERCEPDDMLIDEIHQEYGRVTNLRNRRLTISFQNPGGRRITRR